MEIRAKLNRLRISPQKIRLVSRVIGGLSVDEALSQLNFINKKGANYLVKLLNSAVANAENNFKLKKSDLYLKNIFVNEGPVLKRWKPRAFGRATPIRKKSSLITIILAEKEGVKKKAEKVVQKTAFTQKQIVKTKLDQKKKDKTGIKIVSAEEIKKLKKKKEHQNEKEGQIKPKSRLGALRERFLKRTTEK